MKKVLFIAYYYPPAGGAGVQRTVKFVKYLPQFGWDCAVVAGDGFIKDGPNDSQLAKEVKDVPRYDVRLNLWEKLLWKLTNNKVGRRLLINRFSFWVSAAYRAAVKAIEIEGPDIVFITVSPYDAARVGIKLKKKLGIKWVLDMRDPWSLDPINFYTTKLHYKLDMLNMAKACRSADMIIMNTPSSLKALLANFSFLNKDKCSYITNGYDEDDFKDLDVHIDNHKPLKIVHTGLFHTRLAIDVNKDVRRKLGLKFNKFNDLFRYNIADTDLLTRTPYYLFNAVKMLLDEQRIDKSDIKLIFAGFASSQDKMLVDLFNLGDVVEYKGYLNHNQSVKLLMDADVLFLPLHKSGDKDPLIVPGKTYEYMASGRHILGLVPKGDCADFLTNYKNATVVEPDNSQKLADVILDLKNNRNYQPADIGYVKSFERKLLSEKLSILLKKYEW